MTKSERILIGVGALVAAGVLYNVDAIFTGGWGNALLSGAPQHQQYREALNA